jgi:hypothetical protein
MTKQFERLELNHLITEDALLSQFAVFEVSGSIHQVPPGPAVLIERKDGTFDAALPLKEDSRGD